MNEIEDWTNIQVENDVFVLGQNLETEKFVIRPFFKDAWYILESSTNIRRPKVVHGNNPIYKHRFLPKTGETLEEVEQRRKLLARHFKITYISREENIERFIEIMSKWKFTIDKDYPKELFQVWDTFDRLRDGGIDIKGRAHNVKRVLYKEHVDAINEISEYILKKNSTLERKIVTFRVFIALESFSWGS
ncbi:MAG: hypothetical protein EU530_10835 [Promethearchaeota archaeon]|nr:MAG: hypothetical protein EU530_10835 [Candidatus Lokiarchaeota archaeon]